MTGSQIGTDSFRVIAETALKADGRVWRRYDRIRADISEAAALAAVSAPSARRWPTRTSATTHHGRASVTALGTECPSPQAVGDQTECDGLFVIEDVAICVEVKGRAIADPARRGDRARLASEIKKIFGEGARQAQRPEQLILRNHGVWLGDGSWLDLAVVREVPGDRLGLDDFGPLAVALGDLDTSACSGKEPAHGSPRCTTLRSSARLSIVRPSSCSGSGAGRTPESPVLPGIDELDLFMLFMEGGLYVEPDPDEVRRDYPAAGPSRSHAPQEAPARRPPDDRRHPHRPAGRLDVLDRRHKPVRGRQTGVQRAPGRPGDIRLPRRRAKARLAPLRR